MRRALLAAVAMFTGAAHAQEGGAAAASGALPRVNGAAAGNVVFEAGYFAGFNPQNALDMVNRVPGFTIDDGDDRRGFSGAVGNVLIDGRRPSTKNEELDDVLSRIPAAQVERIELIRDVASRSDAAGQSTLVNVVRTPSAGAGIWQGELEWRNHGRVSPGGNASWTGRTGALDYSFGASRDLEYYPIEGERFYYDGAGALLIHRLDESPRSWRRAAFNADAAFPLLGGSMRVNTRIDRWHFQLSLDQADENAAGAPLGNTKDTVNERRQNEELGVNYDRRFGAVSLELIGLATRGRYANNEATDIRTANPLLIQQQRRNEYRETIGRGTLSWQAAEALRLDVGGEVALNSLDAGQRLTVGGAAVPLPAANVLVEEKRAEAFVTASWRPAERWTLEAQLAGEMSTLTQSGDTQLETDLSYAKPSLQLTRRIGERNQVRFRVYRDVDQLNFDDFVSFAGLADNLVKGGNPNLLPENSWRAELAGDLRFGQDGALGVRVFHHWLRDASDVVPVGPPGQRFDAPGNIGDGYQRGVQVTASVPLGALLPGARLTTDSTWWDTEVTDPVTAAPRRISVFPEAEVRLNFRQDLPAAKLAWGLEYYKQESNITYRINEIDHYEEGPFLDFFIETTAIPKLKTRFYAANLLDSPFTRKRTFFDGDRNGPIVLTEHRSRTRRWGSFFGVTVSGSF
ncbi:MAG: hypothetical protein JNJ73_05900 [Hyphomonadaceae bacterium]|nr:hypothetical protein [Hyphomonadaceae bacterium]